MLFNKLFCPFENEYLDKFITFPLGSFLRRIDIIIVFRSLIKLSWFFEYIRINLLLEVFSGARFDVGDDVAFLLVGI